MKTWKIVLICIAFALVTTSPVVLYLFIGGEPADFPIAIRGDGPTITAVVCKAVSAERITVQFRGANGGDWTDLFEAKGHGEFRSGDELFQSSRIQGMSIFGPVSLRGKEVAQFMILFSSPGSTRTSFFFNLRNFSNETWLHVDGSVSKEPCP
ncbi:MAG: hypothetical protein KF808_01870 [Cryobacterium sp.]|nr:hypothetical protein [Cryobacterium sp.]